MSENEYAFLIKIVKSIIYTFAMVIVSIIGTYSLINMAFKNMSVEQSNTWAIMCMCIGIIFAIFFCMFTILDELKKKR